MGGICDRGNRDGAASATRAAGLLGISGDAVFDPGFCPCPGAGEYMEKTCLLKACIWKHEAVRQQREGGENER